MKRFRLFRTKSIAQMRETAADSGMAKTLGAFDLILLGIGCVIGTGIFVLTGVAAARYAGPAVTISFILSGCACALAGLAYAEFSSIVPASGSAYTYTYASLGEFIAFIVGWNLILEYTVTASAVASGWSGYVVGLLQSAGIEVSHALTHVPADGGIINIPAIFITLLLSIFLIRGTQGSSKLNRILVFIKLAAIFIFLFLAAPHVDTANWDPFMPFGFAGIAGGAAIVFFAYIGFDAVATTAEECKNPAHDLPIGIIGSLVICTALYVVVAGVLTGVVPYTELNNPEPVAFALRYIGYRLGSAIVGVGAIAGITTVLLVLLYGPHFLCDEPRRHGSGTCLQNSQTLPYAVHCHGSRRRIRLADRGICTDRTHRRNGQHRNTQCVPRCGHRRHGSAPFQTASAAFVPLPGSLDYRAARRSRVRISHVQFTA